MKQVIGYGLLKKSQTGADIKINGKIIFVQQLLENILGGKLEVKIKVTIKEDEESKTNPQLRYYFGVVVPCCQIGYRSIGWEFDKQRTDTELRLMAFSEEVANTTTGEIRKFPASLSAASKEDVSEFIDACVRFASIELGVTIPKPDETFEELNT